MNRFTFAVLIVSLLALMNGCVAGCNTAISAALGTGLGALTGVVVGDQTGHEGGAIIGPVNGAVAEGPIRNAEDASEEWDTVIAQVEYERMIQQANSQAMTNSDLVFMAQSGVSDDVIKTAVNTRGRRFDLSRAALVQLKNSGVSDRVVLTVQSTRAAQPVVASANQIYAPVLLPEVVHHVLPFALASKSGHGITWDSHRHPMTGERRSSMPLPWRQKR